MIALVEEMRGELGWCVCVGEGGGINVLGVMQ